MQECPIGYAWGSSLHRNVPKEEWIKCPITVRGQWCVNCNTFAPKETVCFYKWYVCKKCYPNVCPLVKQEVEGAKKGKIVWVDIIVET